MAKKDKSENPTELSELSIVELVEKLTEQLELEYTKHGRPIPLSIKIIHAIVSQFN